MSWSDVGSPASLEELDGWGVLGNHFGDAWYLMDDWGIEPSDDVFWRVDCHCPSSHIREQRTAAAMTSTWTG